MFGMGRECSRPVRDERSEHPPDRTCTCWSTTTWWRPTLTAATDPSSPTVNWICLTVAQVLLGHHNERRWVRHVHADSDLLGMFPALLGQSGYHRRLKTARPNFTASIIQNSRLLWSA